MTIGARIGSSFCTRLPDDPPSPPSWLTTWSVLPPKMLPTMAFPSCSSTSSRPLIVPWWSERAVSSESAPAGSEALAWSPPSRAGSALSAAWRTSSLPTPSWPASWSIGTWSRISSYEPMGAPPARGWRRCRPLLVRLATSGRRWRATRREACCEGSHGSHRGEGQRDEPVGAVVVARRDPDPAADEVDVPDATVGALEVAGRGAGGAVGVDRHPPHRLPAQGCHVDGAVGPDGDAARRHLGGRPLGDGVDVVRVVGTALDLGPAVVLAGLDEIELVEGVLSELAGPQAFATVPSQPLDVSVSVGPDRGAAERVARGRVAVRGDAQDLPAEGV